MQQYDQIIIGGGLYGLYAALKSAKQGKSVALLERDSEAFCRATYVNQARIHMGYHYPRSLSTAMKSRDYFERFVRDYSYCIVDDFEQIYATSARFSWTDRKRFIKFCADARIPCKEVSPDTYFQPGLCDGAYITTEYAFDALALKKKLLDEVKNQTSVSVHYDSEVTEIRQGSSTYEVSTSKGDALEAPFILNATYAGVNEIISLAGFQPLRIKYELCEIILCDTDPIFRDLGITVMDGPFFSIMPFGDGAIHSLTSVTFTPHKVCFDPVATFPCQEESGGLCRPGSLYNCDTCPAKPESAYPYMSKLAKKYLLPQYGFRYRGSLYSMKPILMASEVDDSRPTVIRIHSENPTFVSVLSGKINTVYDLDEVLQ